MPIRYALKVKNKSKKNLVLDVKKAKLARYLSMGLNLNEASILANVTKSQLGYFRSDPEFEDFVQKHLTRSKLTHIQSIQDAGESGVWQASAWYLERKFPEEFGKKSTVQHEFKVKMLTFQKVVLDVVNSADPALKTRILTELRRINPDAVIPLDAVMPQVMPAALLPTSQDMVDDEDTIDCDFMEGEDL
jgi:hypothetical protein